MSPHTIDDLREQVRAQVVTADDAAYDDARAVHNGMFDRKPMAILRAEQVADVVAAVNYARDAGLELGPTTRDPRQDGPALTSGGGSVPHTCSDGAPLR